MYIQFHNQIAEDAPCDLSWMQWTEIHFYYSSTGIFNLYLKFVSWKIDARSPWNRSYSNDSTFALLSRSKEQTSSIFTVTCQSYSSTRWHMHDQKKSICTRNGFQIFLDYECSVPPVMKSNHLHQRMTFSIKPSLTVWLQHIPCATGSLTHVGSSGIQFWHAGHKVLTSASYHTGSGCKYKGTGWSGLKVTAASGETWNHH